MTSEEVRSKVVRLLVDDFRVPESKVSDDVTFRGTCGMDSLDTVDFIYLVSKTFALKPEIAEFRDLHTMGLVIAFIVKKLAERSAAGT